MEDLNDLVLFASVVTHGSFSGAARALGIPKSRVSRRVADLETRLGVRLLQRSTRAVHVTDVGSAFYTHCESMTQAARAAFEVAEHAGEKPSGRLRVSCPVGVAHVFIAPVLSKFLHAQPDVRLELDVTNRRVDVIGDGYDVALRVRSTLDDSNLVVRSFGVSDQVLVASRSFVAEHGPFETPESMHGVMGVGIGGAAGERTRWRLTAPEGGAVDIDYIPALVTDDLYLIGQTTLAGVGVAQLPFNLCAEPVHDGRLVVLLPEYRLPAHQFHAVFPSRRGLVPAVRAFIEFLAEELPDMTANVGRCYEDIVRKPDR
ncbi:LysR substrate-binding domain-containing protein [Ralstonia sp. SET104]|uniref:LysR substrate-binding domain-containing protein n=1 Tax=Ralstonia sp. SET104 TaxID=2448774 RepID=UPI000F571432|nr:LysR substrate-binding domain-containing protein [Ralstonia sp. SET104]GCB04205.1 transcriptional regulator [Ralstonia sp. SET104]